VTISKLLGEESPATPICIDKKGDRPLIARVGSRFGYSYEAVAQKFTNKMMDPFILTLPVHPKKRTLYRHEGQEILYVLEGTMRFLHGAQEYLVEEGDCAYFDSGVPHFGESVGDKAVKCFMVIFSPGSR
jgi:mannose-6-phosphate isomerase-like protein (cupin superfamily)